MQLSISSQ